MYELYFYPMSCESLLQCFTGKRFDCFFADGLWQYYVVQVKCDFAVPYFFYFFNSLYGDGGGDW